VAENNESLGGPVDLSFAESAAAPILFMDEGTAARSSFFLIADLTKNEVVLQRETPPPISYSGQLERWILQFLAAVSASSTGIPGRLYGWFFLVGGIADFAEGGVPPRQTSLVRQLIRVLWDEAGNRAGELTRPHRHGHCTLWGIVLPPEFRAVIEEVKASQRSMAILRAFLNTWSAGFRSWRRHLFPSPPTQREPAMHDQLRNVLSRLKRLQQEAAALERDVRELVEGKSGVGFDFSGLGPEQTAIFQEMAEIPLDDRRARSKAQQIVTRLEGMPATENLVQALKAFLIGRKWRIRCTKEKCGKPAAPLWQRDSAYEHGGRLQWTHTEDRRSVSHGSHTVVPTLILMEKPVKRAKIPTE
jgi:hypothetical protein